MANVKSVVGNDPMVAELRMITADGLAKAQDFKDELGDVIISTYPKTGTTWMQQICHQLRTGGHTDFPEISEEGIVPWIEVGPSVGIDITLPQTAQPRCFKTHQALSSLSHLAQSKFLCTIRDPEATLLSEFKFSHSKGSPATQANDVNVFARSSAFIRGGEGDHKLKFGKTMWECYTEYWQSRSLPEVYVIPYEHMRKRSREYLYTIANFMDLPAPSDELIEKVLELSSFEWMQAHENQFDDHHMDERLAKLNGKGAGKGNRSTKVGLKVGEGVNVSISDETRELLIKQWQEHVTPITGHQTYRDMLKDFEQIQHA